MTSPLDALADWLNVTLESWRVALPPELRCRFVVDSDPHTLLGTPCWRWVDGLNRNGYGRRSWRSEVAHRELYELLVRPVPTGLILDHLCRVHCCVNPLHLEPVTPRVNTLRGSAILFRSTAGYGKIAAA